MKDTLSLGAGWPEHDWVDLIARPSLFVVTQLRSDSAKACDDTLIVVLTRGVTQCEAGAN